MSVMIDFLHAERGAGDPNVSEMTARCDCSRQQTGDHFEVLRIIPPVAPFAPYVNRMKRRGWKPTFSLVPRSPSVEPCWTIFDNGRYALPVADSMMHVFMLATLVSEWGWHFPVQPREAFAESTLVFERRDRVIHPRNWLTRSPPTTFGGQRTLSVSVFDSRALPFQTNFRENEAFVSLDWLRSPDHALSYALRPTFGQP